MKKMVDLDKLAQAISAAIHSVASEPEESFAKACKKTVGPKRKPGRPPKGKKKDNIDRSKPKPPIEIVSEPTEEVRQIILDNPQPQRNISQNYVATTKRAGGSLGDKGVPAIAQVVQINPRNIKFIDDPSVPRDRLLKKINGELTEVQYPEPIPTARMPAVMGDFICDRCHRPFKDYYSNLPQAAEGALVWCPKCSTR